MSFGGSNPPWQRNSMGNTGQAIPSLQSQMGLPNPNIVGFPGNQTMYNQSLNMNPPSQNNLPMISSMGGSGLGNNQMFNQTVAYPTTRGNMGQMSQMGQGNAQHSAPPPHPQWCRKFGTVTKIQNDFGFIDEEVFFHKNTCKGQLPKVGDRVLVEAEYSTNSAFKWNATRVQLAMPNVSNINSQNQTKAQAQAPQQHQQQQVQQSHNNQQRSGSGYNAVPPPNAYAGGFDRGAPGRPSRNSSPPVRRISPDRHSSRNHRETRFRDAEEDERKRRHDDRDIKEKERPKERRERSIERRDHSPVRRSSPKRRRTRTVPRYMVQIPKINLSLTDADLLELKRRYANLYIPSDFFNTQICWPQSFPPQAKFSLQKPCSFHIMHRSVEGIKVNDAILDPPDADYLFSAKVMLMGVPPMTDVYRKCFLTAEEKDLDEERSYVHPTRLINFLVGLRGKNEPMAIGGAWSESLDGPNPQTDPSVLIRTAIRTCRALTGIDLTPCTQWYRFVELYYRRSDSIRKGRTIPARVETVVIYLPDIRSCIPTRIEWDSLHTSYKKKMEQIINQSEDEGKINDGTRKKGDRCNNSVFPIDVADAASSSSAAITSNSAESNTISNIGNGAQAAVAAENVTDGVTNALSSEYSLNSSSSGSGNGNIGCIVGSGEGGDSNVGSNVGDGIVNSTGNENTATNDKVESVPLKREPTNYNDLDPRTMKISDLRDELEARNLSSKGLKPQLIARLTKVLKTEETDANATDQDNSENEQQDDGSLANDGGDIDMTDIVVIDEYDSTKTEHRERVKEDESKPMDERERRLIEKRYQLPDNPELIVHPSRTAKSGKFFCNVMSLSILLDYRPEDSKEHTFEVSLFAELFNEMLMRDFGFTIYKALHSVPEAAEKDKEKEDDKDGKRDDKAKNADSGKEKNEIDGNNKEELTGPSVKDDNAAEQNGTDKDRQNNDDREKDTKRLHKEKDRERDKDKDRKRRKDDETDDDSIKSADPKRKSEKDRQKYVTVDPDLLLSFVYFDQSHCGYIFEKDVEELFYTLGLNLSRAQTRKLVSKVVSRDSLFYRKLTDRPKDEKMDTTDDSSQQSIENYSHDLAKGNKIYLPIFRKDNSSSSSGIGGGGGGESGLIENKLTEKLSTDILQENGQVPETYTGMVSYKGGLIDIEKLLEQMRRSERARDETEQLLVDLRKSNSDLLSSYTRSKDKINHLLSDVKSYSRKLKDTEDNLLSVNRKCSDYYAALSSVHDRITPIITKSERGTSRNDKDREKRDRDRDEHRDRDKDKEKDEQSGREQSIKADVKEERSNKDEIHKDESTIISNTTTKGDKKLE